MSATVLDKCTQALIVSQHKEANSHQTDCQKGRKAVSWLLPLDVWTVLSPADEAHWTVLSRLHRDSLVPWTCWSGPRRKSRRPSAGLLRDKTRQSKTWAELQFTECKNHMWHVFTFSLVPSVLCSDGWGAIKVLQDHSFTWNGWGKNIYLYINFSSTRVNNYLLLLMKGGGEQSHKNLFLVSAKTITHSFGILCYGGWHPEWFQTQSARFVGRPVINKCHIKF